MIPPPDGWPTRARGERAGDTRHRRRGLERGGRTGRMWAAGRSRLLVTIGQGDHGGMTRPRSRAQAIIQPGRRRVGAPHDNAGHSWTSHAARETLTRYGGATSRQGLGRSERATHGHREDRQRHGRRYTGCGRAMGIDCAARDQSAGRRDATRGQGLDARGYRHAPWPARQRDRAHPSAHDHATPDHRVPGRAGRGARRPRVRSAQPRGTERGFKGDDASIDRTPPRPGSAPGPGARLYRGRARLAGRPG